MPSARGARPRAPGRRAARRRPAGRTRRRRDPSAASRPRSGSSGATVARTQAGRAVGVVDEQPAAGLDDRAGVEPLLAVADRQRHVGGGQPDRGQLGAPCSRRPGTAQVGGGVGEVHPVEVGHDDVRRRRRRGASTVTVLAGPVACSTWTPAPRSAPPAPAAASLSRRAPCEPPVTSRVGRSASRPKARRASAPERGPVEGARRAAQRQADVARVRQRARERLVATYGVNRAPSRLASPGRAFASCTTRGTCARRAAR